MGTLPVKIYTVNITNGNNLQLNSLSSGPEFQFTANDFDDFVDNVASQIADNSCEENPFTGDSGGSYVYWQADPCCTDFGLSSVAVAFETGTTISAGDGFEYNGNCYEFYAQQDVAYFLATGGPAILPEDIINNACSDSRCDCNNLEKIFLRNCCDSSDKIQVLYSGGTPNPGQGLEFSGNCYFYTGDT